MPVWAKTLDAQAPDRLFEQAAVLEAAAGKDHAAFSREARGGEDALGERVVEPGGDFAYGRL